MSVLVSYCHTIVGYNFDNIKDIKEVVQNTLKYLKFGLSRPTFEIIVFFLSFKNYDIYQL